MPTPNLFYIADEADAAWPEPTTVKVNLNSRTSPGQSGLGLIDDGQSLDLGTPSRNPVLGDTPTYETYGSTLGYPVMTIPLFMQQASFDAMATLAQTLSQALNPVSGRGIIVYQATGTTPLRYIDFYPADPAVLEHGDERGLYKMMNLLLTDGLILKLTRHPLIRRAKVAGVGTVVGNTPTNRHMTVACPGTEDGLAVMTIQPRAADAVAPKIVRVAVSIRRSNPTGFNALYGWNVKDSTQLDVDTLSFADTDPTTAEAVQSARTTFATLNWARRWRHVVTAGTEDAIGGAMDVMAAIRLDAAGTYELMAKYAAGDLPQGYEALEPVLIEADDIEQLHYVHVNLGTVNVPKGVKLTIEGHARRNDEAVAGGNLHWDSVWLAPVDTQRITVQVPSHTSPTRYLGDDLVMVAGTPGWDGHTAKLNSVGDQVGLPGGARVLAAGAYTVQCTLELRNKRKKKDRLGWLRVVDGTGATVEKVGLRSKKHLITHRKHPPVTLHFTASGAASYNVRVEMDSDPAESSAKITIHNLTLSARRYAGLNDQLVVDSLKRESNLYLAGSPVGGLTLEGGYLVLPPGTSGLTFAIYDAHGSHWNTAVTKGKGGLKHVKGRTALVTVDVVPRDAA